MKQYVKAKDKKLYWGGKELFLRGLGVGSWLNMEHFMIGLPTPDSMIQSAFGEVYGEENTAAFFEDLRVGFLTEKDFELLRETGINFIRVPFNHRLLLSEQTGEYRESGFDMLRRLFDLCEQYEIFVMPDLHTSPGGQNPDWHSDNRSGIPQFWEFSLFRTQMAKLWGEIARRFSGYQYLLGYDLLNEPSMANWQALNAFFEETIAEIRKFDTNHAVVLEGDHFAMDFSGLRHFEDDNLILSFHYYPTVWDAGLLEKSMDRQKRSEVFEKGLLELVEIRETYGLPVICSEAGYDLHPEDMGFCMDLLEDTIAIFEKHGVSWAIWTYKDAAFMGMVYPKADSPWMRLVNKIHEKWTHYGEMEQGNRMIRSAAGEFGGISEELQYKLQFRMRAILYEMQKETILIPLLKDIPFEQIKEAPKSFRLENCEVWDCYQKLMQKFTLGGSHESTV